MLEMPFPEDCVWVDEEIINSCTTPNELLLHKKTQQWLRIFNEKERRLHKTEKKEYEFQPITMEQIRRGAEIMDVVFSAAINKGTSVASPIDLSERIYKKITSTYCELSAIQNGAKKASCLHQPFNP